MKGFRRIITVLDYIHLGTVNVESDDNVRKGVASSLFENSIFKSQSICFLYCFTNGTALLTRRTNECSKIEPSREDIYLFWPKRVLNHLI